MNERPTATSRAAVRCAAVQRLSRGVGSSEQRVLVAHSSTALWWKLWWKWKRLEEITTSPVDDCFFAITRDEDWINESIDMLKAAFEELTVERGEIINILGMTVHMERERRRAVINQKRFIDNLISTYGVTKTAITPATGDLMYLRDESYWRISASLCH